MDDFDPSPRASKRRKTATYATSKRTLASSPPAPITEPQSTTRSGRKLPTRRGGLEKNTAIGDPLGQDTHIGAKLVLTKGEKQGEKTTPQRNGKGKTLEDEFLDITATARTKAQPKPGKRNNDSTAIALEAAQDDEEQPKEVQPQSSVRKRRSIRNDEPVAIEQSPQRLKPQKRTRQEPSAAEAAPPNILSPLPKGILTPSKHGRGNRTRPRKSVVFDDDINVEDKDEKEIEEHFGFKDIDSSSKKTTKRSTTRVSASPEDQEDVFEDAAEFPVKELANGVDSEDVDEDDSILENLLEVDAPDSASRLSAKKDQARATQNEDPQLTSIKLQVLSRIITQRLTSLPFSIPSYLETQYATLHTLLTATITAGESNSLLLLGSRGSGKSLLVEHALSDLIRSHTDDFHIVRLSGFFQTDDKLALKEIWRQLGREMAVSEDETGEVSTYADTMASLLSLLSHPEELESLDATEVDRLGEERPSKTSKSVVFIMDEFDLFTMHPRQTLLYNLFDIAQAKKAPIAVIGCSTRMDVVDCLEKRVKSRFNHRWLHIPAAKSLMMFEESVKYVLCLPTEGKDNLGLTRKELDWRKRWNEYIKAQFLPAAGTQAMIKKIFHSTKSVPDLIAALYIPVATLHLPAENGKANIRAKSSRPDKVDTTNTSPSLLSVLPHLPILHLSLLISATRLETIYDITNVNFTLVHKQYTQLLTRSKLEHSSLSSFTKGGSVTGVGLRAWSKETARGAWEELAQWEFIAPASGGSARLGDEGLGGDSITTKMFKIDVTLEEVAWAVKGKLGSAGAGETLIKWCKEV